MKLQETEKENNHQHTLFWSILIALSIIQSAALFFVCRKLPAHVPVHFNFAMKVDRYGSPWELCIVSILTPFMFIMRPLINRRFSQNPANIKIQDGVILFAGTFIAALAWWTAVLAFQPVEEQTRIAVKQLPFFIYVILGIFTVVFGNYEGTIKPNKTMGIRVPWTLADNENWRKTHRFAAPLCVAAGIILFSGGITVLCTHRMIWYLISMAVYLMLTTIAPVVYSYTLSRKMRI
ncbi:MAG: SdpI family protein [Treponema sp.]|nr:SdpI family protein [Treponema sp.]